MTYSAFQFVDVSGGSRVHVVAWRSDLWRWVMPCGLWPVPAARLSALTLPLCGTCDQRTRQVADDTYPLDATIDRLRRTLKGVDPYSHPDRYADLFTELIRLESLRREVRR